ncbi:MAG TPA: DinB family protein, partial [Pyrinomonadaceae bacterium]|nr:DinB family protein [Pyrinomonadaceae bacterium]
MQDFIGDFRRTVEESAARLLSMTEDESREPRAEGKWSAKEILGHLIDSASNNHQRFVRGQL